eukprot:GHUV01015585.1.p1 GENE.GHUV01015585.1~~GHUV01015585.1.p1  ORF type:complete len:156 (+),score=28.69 GHUV01015585.1:714-1181(+)
MATMTGGAMEECCKSGKFVAFVVHRGPQTKDLAVEIKQMLEKQKIQTFVDEIDLSPGQDAPEVMRQTLHHAKAAIVLFCSDFFKSKWCVEELEYVLELHAKRQSYIPVYLSSMYDQVEIDARNHYGKGFAKEVSAQAHLVIQCTSRWLMRHREAS